MDESQSVPRHDLQARLAALRTEYDKGQAKARQLDGELTSLRETMLRINGAILVLEELLSPPTTTGTLGNPEAAGMIVKPNS